MRDSSTEGLSTGCSGVTFHASLAAWSAATTGSALQVTFEEALWPVNQSLTGPWTLNGLTFQGFAGTPAPNIFVANFGSPFGSPQWLTANGDESIDITPAAPLNAIAFDAKSNGLGQAFIKVFDTHGALIGGLTLPIGTVRFVGITSGVPIGHVNFSSTLGAVQDTGLDSVRTASYSEQASPDLDGDGHVNGADLGMLLGSWGGSSLGDLNCDGTVDGADLGVLLGAWTG